MKREMLKTVEAIKGKNFIPGRYDLTAPEINTLHKMVHSGAQGEWDALTTAFDYGFVLGARAQKAGKLQKKATAPSSEQQAYIEMISRAAKECPDVDTLDLVYKMLIKC